MQFQPLSLFLIGFWTTFVTKLVRGEAKVIENFKFETFPNFKMCVISRIGELFGHSNIVPVPGEALVNWLRDGRERTYVKGKTDTITVHGTVFNAPDASNVFLEAKFIENLRFDNDRRLAQVTTTFWSERAFTWLVRLQTPCILPKLTVCSQMATGNMRSKNVTEHALQSH